MPMPLIREMEHLRAMNERGGLPEERLVAVANASLDVVLVDPRFAELTGLAGAIVVGRNLRDLVPEVGVDVGRLTDLLLRRVAGEVTLANVGENARLVASFAAPETNAAAAWVLLTIRPARPRHASRAGPHFVGRAEHLDAFDRFLLGPDGAVLVVEGPVGIGKSATLAAFLARCQELVCPVFSVEARTSSLEAGVLEALAATTESQRQAPGASTGLRGRRWVLLVDDFDVYGRRSGLGARDPLRGLPDACRVVVSTRSRVAAIESIGPRYRTLFCRLSPLRPEEALDLGARLEVDDRAALLRADGHPLSIHALAHGPTVDGDAVDRLLVGGDLPISRDLLEVAALPPRLTEDILFALVDDESLATKAYDALGSLCYPDHEDLGLRMPDVFRRALSTHLRRRNPARHASLRLRLARHYLRRVEDVDALYAPSTLDDLVATFEDDSVLARMFGDSREAGFVVQRLPATAGDALRPFLERLLVADIDAILTRLDEGIPTYVLKRGAEVAGVMQFAIMTPVDFPTPTDRLRTVTRTLLHRFGAGADTRSAVMLAFVVAEDGWGPASRTLARHYLKLLLTSRRLTALVSIVAGNRPNPLPGLETVELDEVAFRVRDLRQISLADIVVSLVQSSEDEWDPPDARSSLPPPIPPDAVRLALASLDHPTALRASALSWLVADGDPDRLRGLLTEAIEALRDGEDLRQHEILKAVYLDKRGKHELIASELAMPYSTFRRHLARGIERVREVLTERASSGSPGITGL